MPAGFPIKRLLFVPPVLVGVLLIAWQVTSRSAPEQAAPREVARAVRAIAVEAGDYVPRALGYGFVEPGSVWEAMAQVEGKIVYRHPELERGRVLAAGTTILRIDPVVYELAVARAQARLANLAAQLNELEIRESNARAVLEIEERALSLAEADLTRKKALLERGNASQATVDQAETALLAQRERVQDVRNQLLLIPAERRLLETEQALRQVELEQAELDLSYTEIRMPFDGRIAEVTTETAQFAAVNQKLAVADSIDVAEVSAQLAMADIRPLVPEGRELTSLSIESLAAQPQSIGFSAKVRLRRRNFSATWDARFDRISDTVDPQTRTLGLIVAVDDPYRKTIPGVRPPLIKNLYVEVEMRGPMRTGQIVVPRVSVHTADDGGTVVYLIDSEDRLEMRSVTAGPAQGDFVVVQGGLEPGERLIVSDLVPAIEGMLLAPRDDPALAARLMGAAAGQAEVR